MNIIQKEPYTPLNIGDIHFRIPLYQRSYAWNDKQVLQLLNDLYNGFQKDATEKYYIGILNIGEVAHTPNLYDLIDGQQRITTLLLIGKSLRKYYSPWDDFLSERLDIYGREADKRYLTGDSEECGLNIRMKETCEIASKYIEKLSEKREGFAKYVYENAAFFLSVMPDNYSIVEKNLHFVRMNNRGKQLEQHDILKMRLANALKHDPATQSQFVLDWNRFAQLGCSDNKVSAIDTKKSIAEILSDSSSANEYSSKESEIFYESIITYPEFLLIALSRFEKFGKPVSHSNKDKLLQEFSIDDERIWIRDNVLSFYELLKTQFEIFDRFIIKRDKKEGYKFKSEYSNFDGSTKSIEMFQAFQYVSKEPHTWLSKVFDYLSEIIHLETIQSDDFLQNLKEIDNNAIKLDSALSLNYGADGIRYWFWRLDYYLWEKRDVYFMNQSLDVSNNYVFRANRSIEHIAPQNPRSQSNITITNDNLRHWFGNLAMISSGQNSSLQNESYEVKMAHVDSFIKRSVNGGIESLKLLKVRDKDMWNEDVIADHGNEMIDVLVSSFENFSNYTEIRDILITQKRVTQ